jgi:hypothetical protein
MRYTNKTGGPSQMKHVRTVGIFVVAALALVAVASASAAAAEPAFYECAEVTGKTGKWEKGCKVEHEGGTGGKYEIEEGIGKGKAFKGSSKGANINIKGFLGMTCTSSSETGSLTSPTSAGDVVIKFEGCEVNGKKCQTTETAGEIVTDPLVGEFGYLGGKGTKSPTAGIDLKAETGEVMYEYKCGSLDFATTGSVLGEMSPVNKWSKTTTLTFKQSSKLGVQVWSHFEGGPEDIMITHVCEIEGCDPFTSPSRFSEESAIEMTANIKGEELMLKA